MLKKKSNLRPKLPYLAIFELKLEKTIVKFKIASLKFVKFQSYIHNKTHFKLGSKSVLFFFFLCKFRKKFETTIVIFEINTFDFINGKNSFKTKNFEFQTKNVSFRYFQARF